MCNMIGCVWCAEWVAGLPLLKPMFVVMVSVGGNRAFLSMWPCAPISLAGCRGWDNRNQYRFLFKAKKWRLADASRHRELRPLGERFCALCSKPGKLM